MTDVYNINAHYTNNPKVEPRKLAVATSPSYIPNRNVFNDEEANKRLKGINDNIKKEYETEKKKEQENFSKFVTTTTLCILAFLGLKKLFKKSVKKEVGADEE